MTPQDIIADVRVVINDNDPVDYRYSDSYLLGCVNRALRRIAIVRPDLFITSGTHACSTGVEQTVPGLARVVEVFGVRGGGAVTETSRDMMDSCSPSWRSAPTGAAVNWMRHSRNPSKFFIYPPASASQVLDIEYAGVLADLDTNDTIPLALEYQPPVIDVTAAEVEWGDDEYVLTPRAKEFYERAVQALTGNLQTRQYMDVEAGGGMPAVAD